MDYYLREALKQRKLEMGRRYDLAADPDCFPEIYQDIASTANSWVFNCIRIVDTGNWRFKNLIHLDEKTIRIRKPKLLLSVELTSQNNLVLSWYPISVSKPANYHELDEERNPKGRGRQSAEYSFGDWLAWDCQNQQGEEMRHNAIILIHHFDRLIAPPGQNKKLPPSEQCLLKAAKSRIENVVEYLSQLVEVEIQDILYLEETADGLIGRIRGLKEVEAEQKIWEGKNKKKARKRPAKEKQSEILPHDPIERN